MTDALNKKTYQTLKIQLSIARKFRLYHHPEWDAWRVVVEGSWLAPEDFPADCPRRTHFHLLCEQVAPDSTPLCYRP